MTADGVRAVTEGIRPNAESHVRDVDRKLPWLRVRMPTGEHFKEVTESVVVGSWDATGREPGISKYPPAKPGFYLDK